MARTASEPTTPSFNSAHVAERIDGRGQAVRRYPGWMLGPALSALQSEKITGKVRIDLHLSQGTMGSFDIHFPARTSGS